MTAEKRAAAKKRPAQRAVRTAQPTPQDARSKPAAAPKRPTLQQRVDELETQLMEVRWCFAELIHKGRVAAARQMLADPQVQQHLLAQLTNQLATQ